MATQLHFPTKYESDATEPLFKLQLMAMKGFQKPSSLLTESAHCHTTAGAERAIWPHTQGQS